MVASMRDELGRLMGIRQRRVEHAQQQYAHARAAQLQAQDVMTSARAAHEAHRTSLPQLLQAVFADVLGARLGLNQLAGARQKEADLYAHLEALRLAYDEAQDAYKQAQEKTKTAQDALHAAQRKQEALRLLEADYMAQERLLAQREADNQIDEFAEQSFWHTR